MQEQCCGAQCPGFGAEGNWHGERNLICGTNKNETNQETT